VKRLLIVARRIGAAALLGLAAWALFSLIGGSSAQAAPTGSTPTISTTAATPGTTSTTTPVTGRDPSGPTGPAGPTGASAPTATTDGDGPVTVNVNAKPSQSISILLLLTVISVAPSLLLLMTSFTKIFVVLSITRNALGLTNVPPNQVLAGLSLFVSMFVMGPVFTKVNSAGIQPYLHGTKTRDAAFHDGMAPLRDFMLAHTRSNEIALMLRSADLPNPAHNTDVGLGTLIPAFVLSELRSAMIIGFVIYIPFLIIDLVVSSSLMSLGMMMLPPVSVSLPFKLLLFVMVDGWGLVIHSLVTSYKTG
jgi:flagellar biosynthetic protein FliP